jgi:thymidylate synthase
MINKLDKQYTDLLQDILDNGVPKSDRTTTGTLSVFGRQIRHRMSEGFPLLTTKKMPFKTIVTELMWFLRGDTNIKYLVDNGCNIWTGDAYKNYINNPAYKAESVADLMSSQAGQLVKCSTQEEFVEKIKTDDEFAKKWGELGPIYGKQWRKWGGYFSKGHAKKDGTLGVEFPGIDQITNLINELKTNPDSRRLMVSAWNVGEIDQMVLPPCHFSWQCFTRELNRLERIQLGLKAGWKPKGYIENFEHEDLNGWNIPTRAISLMWNQRSVDAFLGLPFNIASYGLLLEIIAKAVNMVPDELIGNLGDTHLYLDHIEQAKEQIGRELSLEERHQLALPIWKEKYGPLADMMVMTNVDNTPYKIPKRTREPYPLPTLNINTEFWPYEDGSCGEGPLDAVKVFESFKDENFCKCLLEEDIQLGNYQSHPHIKAPLSN